MRILVVSTLYPPSALGGYEVECSSVVDRLRTQHEVLVLTSDAHVGDPTGYQSGDTSVEIRRELALLTADERGALRAPLASLRAAGAARRALAWRPELIYSWNGASIPQASLRILADSGVPLAFRVCEHWFEGLFLRDQFMRDLAPASRGPARACWAAGCRILNMLPALRLNPAGPVHTAISWNSRAIRSMVKLPSFVDVELEKIEHSVPRYGDVFAAVERHAAEEPEIAFVGRITPFKGVAVAIEALALLRSKHGLAATLVLIGPADPGHAAELRSLAARLGVSDAVRWRGPMAPDAIAALLARASALIVPSTWDEPFPLVTIEGALARVPLVASDVGGISEGMAHEQHALLFARADAEGAASALARTLQEPEETAARVRRANEHAQAFRLSPYLDRQEEFVSDAFDALRDS